MDLIPDLPHHLGLHCLIRLPFTQFSTIKSVSKHWDAQIKLPEFLRLRKLAGKSQSLVVLSQARVNPTRNTKPVYRLVVLEPETGCWSELPEFSDGLPMFCRMVAVGSDLVVMGGYDPNTWKVLDGVYLFDFLSFTWRRGESMPGGSRSFFGCASDDRRTVVIAGGHDVEKNALKSGWMYDVANDHWVPLPDMAKERDECTGIFHHGKFHVIGGYPTDMQGQFHVSTEIFDVATWDWSETNDTGKCPRVCVEASEEKLYTCRGADVVLRERDRWKCVTRLPNNVTSTILMIVYFKKIFLIGISKYDESYNAYVMDLNKQIWIKVDAPIEYSGHVQSGCSLII